MQFTNVDDVALCPVFALREKMLLREPHSITVLILHSK